MAFFKKYNGSTNVKLVRIERLVWVLVYGGLLSVVIAHFVSKTDEDLAQIMTIGGLVLVAAGAALIYARSRMREEDH